MIKQRWIAIFIVACASWSTCWVGPLPITRASSVIYCLYFLPTESSPEVFNWRTLRLCKGVWQY